MKKVFLGVIIGLLISTVGVYAATTYLASEVTYKDTTVEEALNDLYNKKSSCAEKSEYLVDYKSNNFLKNGAGGKAAAPTLNIKDNVATVTRNETFASYAAQQGTIYINIPEISKYKYLKVHLNGEAKSISLGLTNNFVNNYESIKNQLIFPYYGTNGILLQTDSTLIFDVSDIEGSYTLYIFGTYFNGMNITTQAVFK